MAKVSLIKATYLDPGIDALLAAIGGMGRFVKKNDKVLLKVNLLSAKEPEKAVTTHPELIRAVARAVRKAGGEPYIGDSPAGLFSKRSLKKAYERSGIANLAKEEDIEMIESFYPNTISWGRTFMPEKKIKFLSFPQAESMSNPR